jgi:magnesium-transporting ATPase (P-type)
LKRGLHIYDPKATAVAEDEKKSTAIESTQTAAIRRGDSTVVSDSYASTKDDVEMRKAVFGTNQMPEPILKSLWSFVTDAYQDKMLILLTVAAMVEIGIGGYKTKTTGDSLELIDGFAVLFAGMSSLFPPALIPRGKFLLTQQTPPQMHSSNCHCCHSCK